MPAVSAGFPAAGRPDSRPAGRLRLRGPADSAAGGHGHGRAAAYAYRYPAPGHSGYFPDALPRPDFGISIPARPAAAAFDPGRSTAADRYPGAGRSAVNPADTDAYAGPGPNGHGRTHALNHAGLAANANSNAAANSDTHAHGYAPAYAHALA